MYEKERVLDQHVIKSDVMNAEHEMFLANENTDSKKDQE